MRGNVGVKVFALIGFHFDFSLPNYRKSRFIRMITILVREYWAYFIERNMHVVLEALAMSMLPRFIFEGHAEDLPSLRQDVKV